MVLPRSHKTRRRAQGVGASGKRLPSPAPKRKPPFMGGFLFGIFMEGSRSRDRNLSSGQVSAAWFRRAAIRRGAERKALAQAAKDSHHQHGVLWKGVGGRTEKVPVGLSPAPGERKPEAAQPIGQAARRLRGGSHHQRVRKLFGSEIPRQARDDNGGAETPITSTECCGRDAETPITSACMSLSVQRSLRSLRSVGMTRRKRAQSE